MDYVIIGIIILAFLPFMDTFLLRRREDVIEMELAKPAPYKVERSVCVRRLTLTDPYTGEVGIVETDLTDENIAKAKHIRSVPTVARPSIFDKLLVYTSMSKKGFYYRRIK